MTRWTRRHLWSRVVVAHACNPSTLGGRGRQISEFKASLVYKVSSRTARAIQRNSVLKNPKSKNPIIIIIVVVVIIVITMTMMIIKNKLKRHGAVRITLPDQNMDCNITGKEYQSTRI